MRVLCRPTGRGDKLPQTFQKLSQYVTVLQGLLLQEVAAQVAAAAQEATALPRPLRGTVQVVAKGDNLADVTIRLQLGADQRAPRVEDLLLIRVAGGPDGDDGGWIEAGNRLALVTESKCGADNATPTFRCSMKLLSCAPFFSLVPRNSSTCATLP